jgi:hypothetical protein
LCFSTNNAAHQHRQGKIQQAQNRFAGACANPALVHLSVIRFNTEPFPVCFGAVCKLVCGLPLPLVAGLLALCFQAELEYALNIQRALLTVT